MKLEKTFNIVIIATPALLLLSVPEAFEFIKTYFITILLLAHVFFQKNRYTFNKRTYCIITYLFLLWLSALFSINFSTALYGYYGRFSQSILFVTSIIIFLSVNINEIKKIPTTEIHKKFIIGSIVPLIYAYVQILQVDPITWNETTNRIFSTLGQPNWFAAYILLVLTSLIWLTVKKYKVSTDVKQTYIWFIVAYIPFLQTKSLSALISFFMVILIFFIKNKQIYLNKLMYLIVISMCLTFFFGNPLAARIENQVKAYDENKTIITEDTAKIRLVLWKSSLEQILNSPKIFVIGVGPENFQYGFERPKELNNTSEWQLIHNKPHNFYIEEFFETGILGLFFWIGTSIYFLSKIKSNSLAINGIGILATSFFSWPTAYLYFLLIFIIIFLIKSDSKSYDNLTGLHIKILVITLLFFSTLFAVSYLFVNKNPCLGTVLLYKHQNFAYECAIKNESTQTVENSYKLNKYNKVIAQNSADYILKKQPATALKIYNNLFERDSNNPVYSYNLGRYYESKGSYKIAYSFYQQANNAVPNYFKANEAVKRLHKFID